MTGVLIERGHLNTGAHTGRKPSGDKGRGQGDACSKARNGQQTSFQQKLGGGPAQMLSHSPRKGTTQPTSPWWASSRWDWEATHLCCLSPGVQRSLQQLWQTNQGGMLQTLHSASWHACQPSLHHFRGGWWERSETTRT